MIDEIRRRRIPQTLIGYVVGLWGGAQVVDFVERRYALSPYWVELFVVAYLVLLPSVVAIAWNKGAPGRQRWSKVALGTVGINAALAVVVLAVGFHGRDLGRVTETVVVETEEGETVEREVPREAFRRTVMLAIPRVEDLSGDDRWSAVEFEQLLEIDLMQNPFLELRSPWLENQRAQRAGLENASRMPRALVHEAARQRGADVFLVSSLRPAEVGFELEIELVSTDDGRSIAASTLTGADVFELADRASVWIHRGLEVPQLGFEDRPVTDLMTESPEALRAAAKGAVAFHLESDFEAAAEFLARATEIDPTFAMAHLSEYTVNLVLGRMEAALPAIEAAMQHSYRLTERTEFLVRATYHGARSDVEKTMAVLGMWARLHPDDPMPRKLLAQNQRVIGRTEQALASLREVLELVPGDVEALEWMVEVASSVGELDTAAEAARRWAELLPNEIGPVLALADVQKERGDLAAASATLERATLLDPTHVDARMSLADLATRQGDLGRAASVYEDLADGAGTTQDRFEAIDELVTLRHRQGRIDAALEEFARWEELAREVFPAGQLAVRTSMRMYLFALDGRPGAARARLDELRATLAEPFSGFIALGDAQVALAAEDTAAAGAAIDALQRSVDATGVGSLQPIVELLRARERLLSGDPEAALAACDRAHALDPSAGSVDVHRSRALLRSGRIDDALGAIERALEVDPSDPRALHQRGRVLAEAGRVDEAITAYERAFATWKDADDDYRLARRARSELEALRQGS